MLWPWNAARAASKRPLPKPRKVHAPVDPFAQNPTMLRPGTGRMLRNQDGAPAHYPGDALTRDYDTCRECGLHICGCEQRFEMQQEAQRAQLARSVDARHSMRPGVQQHLRHGDPRRRSLGYNERDYDESRRTIVKAMKAERDALLADPERGLFEINVGDRLHMLCHAILEHERKLPRQKLGVEKVYENNETLFGIPALPKTREAFKKVGSIDVWSSPNIPADQAFFLNLEASAGKQITGIKNIGVSDSRELLALESELAQIEKL